LLQERCTWGADRQEWTSFGLKAMPGLVVIYSAKGGSIPKIQTFQNICMEQIQMDSTSEIIATWAEFIAGMSITVTKFHTYIFRRDFA